MKFKKVVEYLRKIGPAARHEWMFRVVCVRLAHQIRKLRRHRGWSQAELAEKSGLSTPTINRLERRSGSGVAHCGINTLCPIAAAFDVALICEFCSWSGWVKWIITPVGLVKPLAFDEEFLNPTAPENGFGG